MCTCVVHVYVCACWDQRTMLGIFFYHSLFFGEGWKLSLSWELLASDLQASTHLHLSSTRIKVVYFHTWPFTQGLETQRHVLRLAWQTLCQLSHLPRLSATFDIILLSSFKLWLRQICIAGVLNMKLIISASSPLKTRKNSIIMRIDSILCTWQGFAM